MYNRRVEFACPPRKPKIIASKLQIRNYGIIHKITQDTNHKWCHTLNQIETLRLLACYCCQAKLAPIVALKNLRALQLAS